MVFRIIDSWVLTRHSKCQALQLPSLTHFTMKRGYCTRGRVRRPCIFSASPEQWQMTMASRWWIDTHRIVAGCRSRKRSSVELAKFRWKSNTSNSWINSEHKKSYKIVRHSKAMAERSGGGELRPRWDTHSPALISFLALSLCRRSKNRILGHSWVLRDLSQHPNEL